MAIEMGGNAKATQLTWHNILSILEKCIKDALNLPKIIKQSLGTGH